MLYYFVYWLIYMLIVWGWYILSGTNPDIEITFIGAIIGFSIPSFLPEIIVRIIGLLYPNKQKEFKTVCEEMRVYAMIGNTLLIGLITNSYETRPSVLSFLGYTLFGFLCSYLPMLGLWILSDFVISIYKDKRSIKDFFQDKKKLVNLLEIIKDCSACQSFPGVPGIVFMDWRRYGSLRGIFLEFYWRKEESKWGEDIYNRVINGTKASIQEKSYFRLIENTSKKDEEEDYIIRSYFVVECNEEVLVNRFMKKIYSLLNKFANKYPGLNIAVELNKKSYSKCKGITIKFN